MESCRDLGAKNMVVIYGHGGEIVRKNIVGEDISWTEQKEQKGTGHAVLQAFDLIDDDAVVIVAYGDVPLIKPDTLRLHCRRSLVKQN